VKIAYVSRAYPGAVAAFTARNPGIEDQDAAAQRAAWESFAFGWAGAWGPALAPLGHEFREWWLDLESLARTAARARGAEDARPIGERIAEEIRAFAPDVLWLDVPDGELLARLRSGLPSLRAAVGWVGSAVPDVPLWRDFDLVLSCDAAAVAKLVAQGARAALLHHAFQERVLASLASRPPAHDVVFAGQFDPGAPAHAQREQVLEALLATREVAVFGATAPRGGIAATAMKQAAWSMAAGLRSVGVPDDAVQKIPGVGRAASWPAPPRGDLPPRLARALRPPRFGLDMYQTLRDSKIALNVQGTGRTHESSNMRLFESTGVGAALLTDAAASLATFFEPGREVITFGTPEECVERATWLLAHDRERVAIAAAGQRRCLAAHTFALRAPRLVELLGSVLR